MTLECGCVVANGRLEGPCAEHTARERDADLRKAAEQWLSAQDAYDFSTGATKDETWERLEVAREHVRAVLADIRRGDG